MSDGNRPWLLSSPVVMTLRQGKAWWGAGEAGRGARFWECRLVSVTQPWLLSVLAACTFPLIPGGSAIPPAIPLTSAGSVIPLPPSSLASAGSAIPLSPSPLALAGGARPQGQQ